VSVALTRLKLIDVVMTADWRWIADVSQSGGPDSWPRLEGAQYVFAPTQPTYPTFTHTLAYIINQKTPPLPGLAQWACYKGLSIWVQSKLDHSPKDDDDDDVLSCVKTCIVSAVWQEIPHSSIHISYPFRYVMLLLTVDLQQSIMNGWRHLWRRTIDVRK